MREIKFRVWDNERKEMLPIQRHSFKTGKSMPYGWNMEYVFDGLMQYTGLKDKNGTEIYEGDIVKYKRINGSFDYGEIQYNGCAFDINNSWNLQVYASREIEVIGNIYENPELLEGN